MYARDVEGQLLTFGVSGKLIMNGLVMFDRETDSLWAQVTGQAVEGSLKGTPLTIVPAVQTTWQKWVSAHPDTLVLDKRGSYRSDPYRSYYSGSSTGIIGESVRDVRLPSKELVVGVTIGGVAKAYPFSRLADAPVVNDLVDGVALLVTFDQASGTGVVYNPMVDGARLNFRRAEESGKFLVIEDLETGTLWDPLTGMAREGPLAGTTLEQVASHYEFWFAWKDYRPETELFEGTAPDVGGGSTGSP